MPPSPVILWFRQDLRQTDNLALRAAVARNAPILPVYILDDAHAGAWKIGGAGRVWLHHSLTALNRKLGDVLVFRAGSPEKVLGDLIAETGASAVFWNRCYEPHTQARDTQIKKSLLDRGVHVESFNANLMYEPWTIKKNDDTPYRVFTPFWRRGCAAKGPPPAPLPPPTHLDFYRHPKSGQVDDLNLLPQRPRWDTRVIAHWTPGEDGAQARFSDFLDQGLRGYKAGRDQPAGPHTSRLSPHLHWGEISPRQIYHTVIAHIAADPTLSSDGDHFLSEMGWREFSYHLLHHNPTLPETPLQGKFAHFPWVQDDRALLAWQRGMTGYPIVDAGLRELWQTGYMHNRVRMIVGSFLVKNMLTHWRVGEEWFWETLFDADLANNAASWQWIAGCGADAAPYFRIFNPVLQGEKFDPKGAYVRQFVPEIAPLPDGYLHQPWAAPASMLDAAGVTLGVTYPVRLMEHTAARERAIAAFATI